MRLQTALLITALILLSGCSLGKESAPQPADTPAAAAPSVEQPASQPAQPVETAGAALPAPPVALPQGTPFPGLGRPVAEVFDFQVWQIDDFSRENYSVAGYSAVDYQGSAYAALLLAPLPELVDEENDEGMGQRLLFYRLNNGAATPIGREYESDTLTIDPIGWHDVNGDDLPDLPVQVHKAVDYWDSDYWLLFSLDEEGTLLNLLADFYALNSAPVTLQDMDNDLQPEVEVIIADWYNWDGLCPTCSPMGYKFYAFNPDKGVYEDASARLQSPNLERINAAQERVSATFGGPYQPQEVLGPAISLLLAYDFIGQRRQGWDEFLRLSDPANWTQIDPADLNQLETLREMLRRQFETNQPFAPEKTQDVPG
ncbi:MAG TPA: hypothetical protein G4N96_06870 [Chloroflexi bacterium]|nr:hypothetical protein [Chloroflexota bacterium]